MAAKSRKKVDPLKAKEAKQKKIAIGGMVVLCLLGAVQGPKTLKMLKGPQPVAQATAPAPVEAAPTGTVAPVDGATAGDEATAAASADLATLADSDATPIAADGQLVTFERFESKDPFAPQATDAPAAPAPAASEGSAEAGAAQPSGSGSGAASGSADGQTDGGGTVDGGFTPAPAGSATAPPTAPAGPTLAAATSISVNGTPENVVVDTPFPATLPTFQLVKVAKNGKSVEIGIAGGSYANGEQTIRLTVGKPLTLQNTADGTRYELELLSVAGFAVPKPTQ